MDTLLTLVLGSFKALVLLLAAAGLTLVLRERPARLRAVVWGTALAGCLLIPVVAPLLPSWSLPLPFDLSALTTQKPQVSAAQSVTLEDLAITTGMLLEMREARGFDATGATISMSWQSWLMTIWAVGAAFALLHLGFGLWRVARALRRARSVTDPYWLSLLGDARRRVGCRRPVRLLASANVEIPATVGVLRPAIVVPLHADTWPRDRRQAVLLHEMVHVARFDWVTRMIARITRATYWFNPLAWWAVRRLDLELELACDEEVLALGTQASSYACHLLGIAHSLVRCPAPAISGLEMARRTHLEERIMTILKKTTHRKAGITVLLPAAFLVAAMVPALAAVYPSDPEPRPASVELKQIMTEMREVEERMEPHLAMIEEIEIDMEPQLAMIADIDIEIDDEAIARIELQMQPYIEQLESISIDMEPLHEQLEAMEQEMQNVEVHIDDGTLEEVQFQIQEQIAVHMEMIKEIHIDMGPYMEQIEEIHTQLEPMHEALADIHIDLEPMHEELEKIHISIEPFHEQMEAMHEELEPLHEEMERLGNRLEAAIRGDVAAVLREHLATVTAPGTSYDEAAARIVEDAHVHVNDNLVSVDASSGDVRAILIDLFAPHRVGTQDVFDSAIDGAVEALSPLEIRID